MFILAAALAARNDVRGARARVTSGRERRMHLQRRVYLFSMLLP